LEHGGNLESYYSLFSFFFEGTSNKKLQSGSPKVEIQLARPSRACFKANASEEFSFSKVDMILDIMHLMAS